jgi:multidrug efflux pump subunit AcrA (membrane-fusion protein)
MKKSVLVALVMMTGGFLQAMAEENYQWKALQPESSKQIMHLTGKIVPQDGALTLISARVQGRVLSFLKKEGERVQVGTPLFEVSSAECLSISEEKRVASSRGMQDLVEAVNRREKQLGLQVHGDRCTVTSTSYGTLVKRSLEVGAVFNPGDGLATIVDTNRLTVELEVPEGDIAKVKVNDSVQVQISSTGESTKGVVDVIVPSIDAGTRTGKIRLKKIKVNGLVSLESLVTADLELRDASVQAFLVPQSALVFHNNNQYVLKKKDEGPAIVPVKVLGDFNDSALIQAQHAADLGAKDMILSKSAIFIFRKLSGESVK